MKKPDHIRVVNNVTNDANVTNDVNGINVINNDIDVESRNVSPKCHSEYSNVTVEEPPLTLYNLAAEIRNYIEDHCFSPFTIREIDEFLGIDKSQQKNRSKVLSRLCKKNYIKRIENGRYERVSESLQKGSIFNVDTNHFDITLPLGLSDMVNIPKKSIIVISGTANAGKTQFAMEIIRLNLHRVCKDYPMAYFYSEMGDGEFANRVISVLNNDMSLMKKFENDVFFSGDKSSNFPPVITAHCHNGLGIIDYLEAPEGDYSKIVNEIKRIYDRITTGVVCLCMQKGKGLGHARGGEGTKEKARLFLTMDTIRNTEAGSMIAINIGKAKDSVGANVTDKEIHVLARKGHDLMPLSGWQWVKSDAAREKLFDVYETESDGDRKLRMLETTEYVETKFTPDEEKVEGLF